MCIENQNSDGCEVATCSIVKMLHLSPEQKTLPDKFKILKLGRPTPQWLSLNVDDKNVMKINALELFEEHKWMTGCPTLNKIFCWPCLFFDCSDSWSIGGLEYDELDIYCIKRHLKSIEHRNATKLFDFYSKQKSIIIFDGLNSTQECNQSMNSISKSSSETTQNYNCSSINCDELINAQEIIASTSCTLDSDQERMSNIEEMNIETIPEVAHDIKKEFIQEEIDIDEDPLSISLHENLYHETHDHPDTEFILPHSNEDVIHTTDDLPISNKRESINMLQGNDAKRFKTDLIIDNTDMVDNYTNEPNVSQTQNEFVDCKNFLGLQNFYSESVIPKETILDPVVSYSPVNKEKYDISEEESKTCVNTVMPQKPLIPGIHILKANESPIQNSSTQVACVINNTTQYFILRPKNSTSTQENNKNGVIHKLLSIPPVKFEIVNGIKNITISYEVYEIISLGRPKPELTKLKPANHEKNCKCGFDDGFDTYAYERIDWLTGCEITNKLFCWPCVLFSCDYRTYASGYDNLGRLSDTLKKHIKSYYHQQAVNMFNEFCKKHLPPNKMCLLQNPSDVKAISAKSMIPMSTSARSKITNHDNNLMKLLSKPFKNIVSGERLEILCQGRPTPPLPDAQYYDEESNLKRTEFLIDNYTTTPWLTACSNTNKLYCWPCVLFNKNINKWNSGLGYDVNPNMHKNISKHNTDLSHLEAVTKFNFYQNAIQRCSNSNQKVQIGNILQQENDVNVTEYTLQNNTETFKYCETSVKKYETTSLLSDKKSIEFNEASNILTCNTSIRNVENPLATRDDQMKSIEIINENTATSTTQNHNAITISEEKSNKKLIENLSRLKPIAPKPEIIIPSTVHTSESRITNHDNNIMKLLSKPFKNIVSRERLKILCQGRPTPPLPDAQYYDEESNLKRTEFLIDNYTTTPWLTACSNTNKLYCWPCLLFNKTIIKWNSGLGYDVNPNMHENISNHSKDTSHHVAVSNFEYYQNASQRCSNSNQKVQIGNIFSPNQQESNVNPKETTYQNIRSDEGEITQDQNSVKKDKTTSLLSDKKSIEFIELSDISTCDTSIKNCEDPLAMTDEQIKNDGIKTNKNTATSTTQNYNTSIVSEILKLGIEKFEEKLKYIKFGRPKPNLPDLKSLNKKNNTQKQFTIYNFNVSAYDSIDWLTGCDSSNQLYCWPCLFFNDSNNSFNTYCLSDLCNLSHNLKIHCNSSKHNDAVKKFNEYSSLNLHPSERCLLEHQSQIKLVAPPKIVKITPPIYGIINPENEDSITKLLKTRFKSEISKERIYILHKGRPTPQLIINQTKTEIIQNGQFGLEYYQTEWLAGCSKLNRYFCWPCLLLSKNGTRWIRTGIGSLKWLSSQMQKHSKNKHHIIASQEYDIIKTHLKSVNYNCKDFTSLKSIKLNGNLEIGTCVTLEAENKLWITNSDSSLADDIEEEQLLLQDSEIVDESMSREKTMSPEVLINDTDIKTEINEYSDKYSDILKQSTSQKETIFHKQMISEIVMNESCELKTEIKIENTVIANTYESQLPDIVYTLEDPNTEEQNTNTQSSISDFICRNEKILCADTKLLTVENHSSQHQISYTPIKQSYYSRYKRKSIYTYETKISKLIQLPIDSIERIHIFKLEIPKPEIFNHKGNDSKNFKKLLIECYETYHWLAGCSKTNRLYCWPCLFFNDELKMWNLYGCKYTLVSLKSLACVHCKVLKHQEAVSKFEHLKSIIQETTISSVQTEESSDGPNWADIYETPKNLEESEEIIYIELWRKQFAQYTSLEKEKEATVT